MKITVLCEFLNRADSSSFHLQCRNQAAVDKLIVDEDRAGAAFSFSTAFFRSSEPQVLAQYVKQAFHWRHVDRSAERRSQSY